MQIIVLGGGILGLTAALRLAQTGHRVTVVEREEAAGGLAAGFRVGHVWLEKFYHHIFRSDRAMIRLIGELGLDDRLVWRTPRNPTFYQGAAHRLDSPATLLRFPPLRPDERVRMGAAMAYLRLLPPVGMEGKRAAPWIRRWMGAGPYRVLWEPALRAKFGPLAEEISLPWFWARVHDRSVDLGYVRGGFQLVYERLTERLRALHGDVRLGVTVQQVRTEGNRFAVATSAGSLDADRVLSTLPPRVTAALVPELPEDYRARFVWGQAYGAHCLVIATDRPVTDGYWMNISDPGFPFMVLVEHTNLMPPSDYGGRHLLYLGNYRAMDDPLMHASKEDVLKQFLPHISRISPAFRPDWVTDSWMFAAPYAQPIVTVDYRDHIPPLETPVPGLIQASMFQVYPHDRGQNYSIELAEQAAALLG